MTYFIVNKTTGTARVCHAATQVQGNAVIIQAETEAEIPAKLANMLALEKCHAERRALFPPIGDQLDMLWHAMDDDTLPKVEPFYSTIKAVKNAVPKPS